MRQLEMPVPGRLLLPTKIQWIIIDLFFLTIINTSYVVCVIAVNVVSFDQEGFTLFSCLGYSSVLSSFDWNVFLRSAQVLTCSLCSANGLLTQISPLTLVTVFLSSQHVLAVHCMVSNPCLLVSVGSHARGQLNGSGQKGHNADGSRFQTTDGSSEYSEDGPAKKR